MVDGWVIDSCAVRGGSGPHCGRMRLPHPRTAAALLAALSLAGCGRSGYGTVDAHQLVLITTALPTSATARAAEEALACGARAEARRLHRALTVQRPRTSSASAQIALADSVTADKPGGIVIVPVAANPMLAPILSMRGAGIKVVRLSAPGDPGTAATRGARAVARAVSENDPGDRDAARDRTISLRGRCEFVH